MRPVFLKTLLASFVVLAIAAGCDALPGQSPEASLPVGVTPGPDASGAPAGGSTASGAIAVVVGPSAWEIPMVGSCQLTLAPVDPNAPPPDVGPGTLPSLEGSTLVLNLTAATTVEPGSSPGAGASPAATVAPISSEAPTGSQAPAASGLPAASGIPVATPTSPASMLITAVLTRATRPGESPAPSPTAEASPAPTLEPGTIGPTVLPYAALPDNTEVAVNLPEQFIFEATVSGGAVAPDGRSGYIAIDPGTGELVLTHFLCQEIDISSAVPETSPAPGASESPAAGESSAPESPSESTAPAT